MAECDLFQEQKLTKYVLLLTEMQFCLYLNQSVYISMKGCRPLWTMKEQWRDIPLQKGPFANSLLTIAHIQELFKDKGNSPIRTALVTSRNAPAHERAIKTLRKWNVHIDEAFFLVE